MQRNKIQPGIYAWSRYSQGREEPVLVVATDTLYQETARLDQNRQDGRRIFTRTSEKVARSASWAGETSVGLAIFRVGFTTTVGAAAEEAEALERLRDPALTRELFEGATRDRVAGPDPVVHAGVVSPRQIAAPWEEFVELRRQREEAERADRERARTRWQAEETRQDATRDQLGLLVPGHRLSTVTYSGQAGGYVLTQDQVDAIVAALWDPTVVLAKAVGRIEARVAAMRAEGQHRDDQGAWLVAGLVEALDLISSAEKTKES